MRWAADGESADGPLAELRNQPAVRDGTQPRGAAQRNAAPPGARRSALDATGTVLAESPAVRTWDALPRGQHSLARELASARIGGADLSSRG
jgi:hypothetical protein